MQGFEKNSKWAIYHNPIVSKYFRKKVGALKKMVFIFSRNRIVRMARFLKVNFAK